MSLLHAPEVAVDLRRIRVLAAAIVVGLVAILVRLWYLQIAHGPELLALSEQNRSRNIRRLPPRGQIEDCAGRVVATNRSRISVFVIPFEAKRNPEVIARLSKLLGQSEQDVWSAIADGSIGPFEPVRVADDVSIEIATRVEEQRYNLPGVDVLPEPVRTYPDGPLLGHVLGQLGEIEKAELAARRAEGYRPKDYCGKLGIEKAFDAALRGRDGGQRIDVDARGRMRGTLAMTYPVQGATLRLTIDKELQRIAYDELQRWAARGRPGAAVALDPNTGAVLALASVPSYDPNEFVRGVSKSYWGRVSKDPLKPLINRAVGSAYAPGSTFKVITASAGLESGVIGQNDTIYCSGVIYLGSKRWPKRCHKLSGHGSLALNAAIAQSCDVFFYTVGQRLGPERIAAFARRFGLGARTGIDLPGVEAKGTVPDRRWKEASGHGRWVGGDTVDYAIGQGLLTTTPLQMCNVAAAIANGGTLYRPQLVGRITSYGPGGAPSVTYRLKPEPIGSLRLHAETLAAIQRGMRSVMVNGTGAASAIPGLAWAGKTGTAEVVRRHEKVNNAWFIGYAPYDHPKIAVCVFIDRGGHGGEVAAPIARKIVARYLKIPIAEARAHPTPD